MRIFREVFFIALVVLTAAAILGLVLTSRPPESSKRGVGLRGQDREEQLIDQRPLETSRGLAAVASSAREQQFAQDAARTADHEVDLAFASALQAAAQQPAPKRNQAIDERIRKAQDALGEFQARIRQLTAEAKERGSNTGGLQQQIAFAQAESDLAQNELAEAQEDQARAGGGMYSRIERLWQEHQATEHKNGATRPSSVAPGATSELSAHSLISRWRAWSGLAAAGVELSAGQKHALAMRSNLTRQHDSLERQVQLEQARPPLQPAMNSPKGGKGKALTKQIAAPSLSSLRQLSQDETRLSNLDRRIQDLGSLAAIYQQWSGLVIVRARAALHRLIQSVLWVVLALLVVSIICRLIDHFFDRIHLERKQKMTLRGILRFTFEVLGALLILFVIFGSPKHMSTVIGLVGAGVAVALKDFVVSFFGWFVLMGRNGVQVGDWVEISGVRGEVVEISLLRTLLLETGNWTEAGHPTGRQVAFLNSYAVEGYYFNFSTSGQWMWDEIPVLIPSRDDPYPVIEKIRALVVTETEEDTRRAEKEWQRATHRCGVRSFSAEPDINVKPTDSGVQLIVRYIVRANERYETRFRLSHAIVKLLRRGETLPPASLSAGGEAGLTETEPATPTLAKL
ncbi:MAG: mechanosensitive ion channel domain-containing protein [Terriglobia bacterium]